MKKHLTLILGLVCLTAFSFFSCKKDNATNATQNLRSTPTAERSTAKSGTAFSMMEQEYQFTRVSVELTDEGKEALIADGRALLERTGETSYTAIGKVGNPPSHDPIVCNGMTMSQIWADIDQKWQAFVNSPQYQQAKDAANSCCCSVRYCISNCAVAVMYAIQPDSRKCLKYSLAEEIRDRAVVDAAFIEALP